MIELALALLLMVLSHAVPSAPPARAWLIARLGRPAFFAGYGTLSLVALVWVILAFRRADAAPWLYLPPPGARSLALFLMPFAAFLVVGRLMRQPGDAPTGVYRITTVPGSLGILLWALLHLLNLGSLRHVLLFGALALIAQIALVKNARLAPPGHRDVGIVPFLAVIRRRERLPIHEIAGPLLAGLGLYVLLLWLHPRVIGPDPLAGMH